MSYQRRLHAARLLSDAHAEHEAGRAVRALIDAPLTLVPMTAKEARKRIGQPNRSHGGDRRPQNFHARGASRALSTLTIR